MILDGSDPDPLVWAGSAAPTPWTARRGHDGRREARRRARGPPGAAL